ncbi:MAG: HDIG domain-containing protein [Flavobacteriaceae bacterium]|nr:HDIG domain-containing protein [Flavobacteriaceae bacterium]
MKRLIEFLYNSQSLIYKAFLYLFSCALIVYFFPVKSQFAFDFSKGQSWGHETLYAPFDFAIIKSEDEINTEKRRLKLEAITYFDVEASRYDDVVAAYEVNFENYFPFSKQSQRYKRYFEYGQQLLEEIYAKGVLPINYTHEGGRRAALVLDRSERDLPFDALLNLTALSGYLDNAIESNFSNYSKQYYNLLFEILEPNLSYNKTYTEQSIADLYLTISPTRDIVAQGEFIITTNEIIDEIKWEKLWSLKQQFSSEDLQNKNFGWIVFGYSLIVSLLLLLLLFFIRKYRQSIFENNTKMTFIFFNILMMVGMTILVLEVNQDYLYALPICIFPLITKTFFDARLGLVVHLLAVLIVGFIVPNSFEYVVLQTSAGIVTILSVSELYKRANLFISVFQITLVYLMVYLAFFTIRVGDIQSLDIIVFGLFVVNGLLTLFVQPLIYLYEKVFKLVSDASLLELSDTNSIVFKELSNKAPGTFHHSLQVANLAEAAALAIDANVLLTRVGALYHDIGKINNPTFFSENQRALVSPHDELSPKDSAQMIIQHVLDGIKLAKQYKLPDRVIDFIRTHHGTSKVYYFYKKQQELSDEVDLNDFSYNGPKPFSKETAIVMMSDAVEAASKSLKAPSIELLEGFVAKIINQQMEEDQFVNSNITFAEIETVKKVLINKLINIYHLRVEYPE